MKRTPTLLLVLLVTASTAVAGFTDTHPEESPESFNIRYDDTNITLVQTHRHFQVTTNGGLYVSLAGNEGEKPYLDPGSDWSVDLYLSHDNGSTYQVLATGMQSTDPSPQHNVSANQSLVFRGVIHFPVLRDKGSVDVDFIIALDTGTDGGGSGGVLNPSIGHRTSLYFYDAEMDSDGDGLPDSWEVQYFGDLGAYPFEDPDGDGYTNQEEYQAGTHPQNPNSHPEQTIIPIGGGGGGISDRELTVTGFSLVIFAIAVFIAIYKGVDEGVNGMGERRILVISLWIGVPLVLMFLVLAGLDAIHLGNRYWAFWAYFGYSWKQALATFVAFVAVLAIGTAGFLVTPQDQERPILVGTLIALGAAALIFVLLFVVADVPFLR